MKTRAYNTFVVLVLMLFSAGGALAQTDHQHDAQKPAQHGRSEKDMSSMMSEWHHVLAMAYMQNIGTFAKTLHAQAESGNPLNAKLARAAVGEIKRSLDKMEDHHGEHIKTMNDEMRSHMAAMMKDMETHRSMLVDAVSALEKDVRTDQPDARQVATDSAKVLEHLEVMSKMKM